MADEPMGQSPVSNEELMRRIEHIENIEINGVRLKGLISMTIDADAWNVKRLPTEKGG